MEKEKVRLGVHDIPKWNEWIILSLQHLFAMFGATILVPILTGLSPAVALVSSGLGTIAYLIITKGQVPAYLGSSFAFIMPIIAAMTIGGPEGVMIGTFTAGIVYGVASIIIKGVGVQWLMNLLPPVVVGPIIMVIGLGLSGNAIEMAMNFDGDSGEYTQPMLHLSVALLTLLITIVAAVFFRGFLKLIPIFIGVVGGYIIAAIAGLVDFTSVVEAPWFRIPDFVIPFVTFTPNWNWGIVALMTPIALVTLAEHLGDTAVLSKVVGKNFWKKPGLHRTIMGDGVATMIASFVGGPPNTTYGENVGVVAITKVFSVFVIGGAASLAIIFGFVGKVEALIASIPGPVLGGVSILLYGIIASSGMRMLIDNQIDFGINRNLIIPSVILVTGIGGAFINLGSVEISGMALATFFGIILNAILPGKEYGSGNGAMFASLDEAEDEKSKDTA
ncbi:uracil-xanthine permease family protein [Bacillus piscicola]|uniref:uracil-xanthine permease family protein n=1 Tax=Bacillus piscicola TaxID=1632684 RepID=UPI001F09B328|nr:solute carrier family 23 protein [Bacillus piscicola]